MSAIEPLIGFWSCLILACIFGKWFFEAEPPADINLKDWMIFIFTLVVFALACIFIVIFFSNYLLAKQVELLLS